jgi:hypothetical protein
MRLTAAPVVLWLGSTSSEPNFKRISFKRVGFGGKISLMWQRHEVKGAGLERKKPPMREAF